MESISLPQDRFIKSDGLKPRYLNWDSTDAVPIILLHGLFTNAHY